MGTYIIEQDDDERWSLRESGEGEPVARRDEFEELLLHSLKTLRGFAPCRLKINGPRYWELRLDDGGRGWEEILDP